MSVHLAARRRPSMAGYLAIALGVGLIAFAMTGPSRSSDEDVQEVPSSVVSSSSIPPNVLGNVITRDTPPGAGPAVPATFDLPGSGSAAGAPPSSEALTTSSSSSSTPSTTPSTTATTRPTTTTEPTTTTTGSTTSTTGSTTSTTESTTTTEGDGPAPGEG